MASGLRSATGSGLVSATGSGLVSATGSGLGSATGSGLGSATGSGLRSVMVTDPGSVIETVLGRLLQANHSCATRDWCAAPMWQWAAGRLLLTAPLCGKNRGGGVRGSGVQKYNNRGEHRHGNGGERKSPT